MSFYDSARGCWMYKPPSTSKNTTGLLAAINNLTKKWSKRWVWTTEVALHYAPRRPINHTSEDNEVLFSTILEARAVEEKKMLKEGAPNDFAEFGWMLRTEKKDILFTAPDRATRDRFVQFFGKYRTWMRKGKPEDELDGVEFLRHQLVSLATRDEPNFSDTSSQVAASSAAYENDDNVRYFEDDEDQDDDEQLEEYEEESEETHNIETDERGSSRYSARASSGTYPPPLQRSSSTIRSPRGSTHPAQSTHSSSQANSRESSAVQRQRSTSPQQQPLNASELSRNRASNEDTEEGCDLDEWDDVDGRIEEQQTMIQLSKSTSNAYRTEKSGAFSLKSSLSSGFPPSKSGPLQNGIMGETRRLLQQKKEERRNRLALKKINLSALSMIEQIESASPSPRSYALLSKRRGVDLTAISTAKCCENTFAPLAFPLPIVGQFADMAEDAVFLDRQDHISGSAIGTVEGLMLRCAGDMDLGRFAKATRILLHCEGLHPRGHEPLQVCVEDSTGKQTIFCKEFGAYVMIQCVERSSK